MGFTRRLNWQVGRKEGSNYDDDNVDNNDDDKVEDVDNDEDNNNDN